MAKDRNKSDAGAGDVDLSVVGTDDLIDELAKRHEAVVFAGVKLIAPNEFEVRVAGRTLLIASLGQAVFVYSQKALVGAMEDGKKL